MLMDSRKVLLVNVRRETAPRSEAEEHAAGVTQENAGWVEVVAQKPETRAGEAQSTTRSPCQVAQEEYPAQADRGDDRQARGQAVEAVDQVERIDDGDDPEHHEDAIQSEGQLVSEEGAEVRSGQPNPECGRRLARQLHERTHSAEVVNHSDDDRIRDATTK